MSKDARDALERLTQVPRGLKREPPARTEFEGLLKSARRRLPDAEKISNSLESRFDLAYNAAHALALAALRWHGYRSENRYLVFQCLPHTLSVPNEHWRVLADAHNKRNRAEYEGELDVDTAIVEAVIRIARELEQRLAALEPPAED